MDKNPNPEYKKINPVQLFSAPGEGDLGLAFRMNMAFLSLVLLFVIGFMAIGLILGLPWFIPVAAASVIIFLQYLISPLIVKMVYKIDWVGLEALEPGIRKYVINVCKVNGVKPPEYGVIHDDNPNAFCFGWTRNRSFLVLTDGIDKYCDLKEKKAVVGHELGHIVHNDFIVMTVICMVPLLFYIIGRSCIEVSKHSSGNNKGAGYVALIGLIAMVIYVISEFIVLLVSRYREYWADGYSARSTRDPNSLSSALIKIAYGLASEGKGNSKIKQIKFENALMISDPRSGRSLAFNSRSITGKSDFTVMDLKEAMAWDMWNPWAKWLELKSSHPLPAKRIMVLDKISEDMGKDPYVGFDLMQPESYIDEFLLDVSAGYGWVLAFPVSIAYMVAAGMIFGPFMAFLSGMGLMMSIIGFSLFLYLGRYRYPMGFRESDVEFLLDDPKASPLRGIPVTVQGRIIGRGEPGLFFNEDFKIDDGTAMVLIDYHQVLGIIDLMEGVFKTGGRIGANVRLKGWYRRMITPYIELYELEWSGGRKKMRTRPVKMGFSLALGILGVIFQIVMPLSMLVLGGYLLLYLGFLKMLERKYERDMERRLQAGPHPYQRLYRMDISAEYYDLVDFSEAVEGDIFPPEGEMRDVVLKIKCPICGTVQEAYVGASGTSHRCINCGLTAQIDITNIRM